MRKSMLIRIPVDEGRLLFEILALLDAEEYAIITFRSGEDRLCGYYDIQFNCEQLFDPDCFQDCNFNSIQFID